jgi:hypothetical protein
VLTYAFIFLTGLELASRQNAKQDTSCLPSLDISGNPGRNAGSSGGEADYILCTRHEIMLNMRQMIFILL